MWKHCAGKEKPAELPSRGTDLFEIANDPLWLKGPSILFDRPIDDDPTLEEATLKECASELKVNDRLQFEEVHSLLVTRPRKNAAETARLKMTLQIKDLEEPDSEVD